MASACSQPVYIRFAAGLHPVDSPLTAGLQPGNRQLVQSQVSAFSDRFADKAYAALADERLDQKQRAAKLMEALRILRRRQPQLVLTLALESELLLREITLAWVIAAVDNNNFGRPAADVIKVIQICIFRMFSCSIWSSFPFVLRTFHSKLVSHKSLLSTMQEVQDRSKLRHIILLPTFAHVIHLGEFYIKMFAKNLAECTGIF